MNVIPVMRPKLPRAEVVLPYLERVDSAMRYSNFGPLVQELESRYAEYLRVPEDRVVSVVNASQGLIGCMAISTIPEWIIPAFTFAATGHAVVAAGKRLVFRDVSETSWIVNIDDPKPPSSQGAVLVIPFGTTVSLSTWFEHTHIVVDAAASLGNPPSDLSQIPEQWSVVFSMHATKVLPAGEGGLVVFGSPQAAERFRQWTNFGFDSNRNPLSNGTNAKMAESTAAYGLASLDGWASERQEWTAARSRASRLSDALGIQPTALDPKALTPYWIIQLANGHLASTVAMYLRSQGIETRRWWGDPLTVTAAFKSFADLGTHPVSESLAASVLGLPMFRDMTQLQFTYVGNALRAALGLKDR